MLRLFTLVMFLTAAGAMPVRAAVLNVDDLRDNLPSAPFTRIADAVTAAMDGDTILVQPGHYHENIDLGGRRLHVRSIDPLDADITRQTIIDGIYNGPVIRFRGDETSETVVEGFTISHGAAEVGGGIDGGDAGNGSAATIRNNVIEYNIAIQYGGGVYRCSGLVRNNVIQSNTAGAGGGGIASCTGPIMENVISNNSASRGGGLFGCHGPITKNIVSQNDAVEGGGLWLTFGECSFNVFEANEATDGGAISGGNGSIHDNIIQLNTAANDGGGIFNSAGAIRSNTIYKNTAYHGGGISGGNGEINGNTIEGNWATISGGGIYEAGGWVIGNLVSGNNAGGSGGGASWCSGPFERNTLRLNYSGSGGALANCTGAIRYNRFQSNHAGSGGALASCAGRILGNIFESNSATRGGALGLCNGSLLHNTFAFNSATTGSAVWTDGSVGIEVRNNIFHKNEGDAALGGIVFGGRYGMLVARNCFYGGNAIAGMTAEKMDAAQILASENFTADPRFVNAPAPNPEPGVMPDNDYRLLGGSPCIDRASWHALARLPARDFDGLCRVANLKPDIGCYERGSRPDADGDGLDDTAEATLGTNPNAQDTDGDGLSDMLEIAKGTSPLARDKGRVVSVPDDQPGAVEAVLFAVNNDRIVLNPGTYYGPLDFSGRVISIQSRQPLLDQYLNTTVIDALGQGAALTLNGLASPISIQGLTIIDGLSFAGGAIYADATLITLNHCIVRDNTASAGGVIEGGSGTVTDCEFSGNYGQAGGCLAKFSGEVHGNKFVRNGAYWGGVLYGCDATTITGNEMTSNTAAVYGGAIFECGGDLGGNTMTGNKAENGGVCFRFAGPIHGNDVVANRAKQGGAFYQCHGVIEQNDCRGNSARYGGVAYDCNGEFRNNRFAGNSGDINGGVLMQCGALIHDNEFSENRSYDGGCLVFCSNEIDNNRFIGNRADGSGGAINTCGAGMSGNLFENNRANQGGGAIFMFEGSITGNTFRGNKSAWGGAIVRGEGVIEGNLFEANTAANAGAVAAFEGEIRSNRFIGNVADVAGGAMFSLGASVHDNVFSANKAQYGGVAQGCKAATFAFNTMADNTAYSGGALHDCPQAVIINNIFLRNGRYAIYVSSKSTSPTLVANNCFYENPAGAYRNFSGVPHTDIDELNAHVRGCVGNIGADPKLVSATDFHLRPESPCIDAGSTSAPLTADFDGVGRPLDGNGDGRFGPDIGMYEFFGVRILNPAAGATWLPGQTVEVAWQSIEQWAGTKVRFELWRGDQRVAVLGEATGSGGTVKLAIPSTLAGGTDYRLRAISVSNPAMVGENPAPITIYRKTAAMNWESYH